IAGMEEVGSLYDMHKKSETNQLVSDFYMPNGSIYWPLIDKYCDHSPLVGLIWGLTDIYLVLK
ncbi:MAG: hypothetical protein ACRC1V_10735, partial [Plesiomonas sp.]